MKKDSEHAIIESWRMNVGPWIQAIRRHKIESRQLVTDRAIIDVIVDLAPGKVLDLGCGEGWLARTLHAKGIDVLGVDAIPKFIEAAQQEGKGRFRTLAHADLSFQALGEKFNVLVCNFSLFGDESVAYVFRQASQLLNSAGVFVVQTLHPGETQDIEQTAEGWREGSWVGFGDAFQDPPPWYFRTIGSWKRLFTDAGFESPEVIEPLHPKTGTPASIIFLGTLNQTNIMSK